MDKKTLLEQKLIAIRRMLADAIRQRDILLKQKEHHHTYTKDRNSTRKFKCECGHTYTPST